MIVAMTLAFPNYVKFFVGLNRALVWIVDYEAAKQ
jgi:hypothetical protein